jgi:membrane-associated protease RseP (regulator of RpoE activity)
MKTKSILIGLTLLASLATPAWCQDRPEREPRRAPEAERTRDVASTQWRIGVMVESLDGLLRKHLQLPEDTGVIADRVVEGSPAARAGLKAGDIILSAGKKPVGDLDSLRGAVAASARSGKPLVLWVLQEGKKQEIRIDPPVRPGNRDRQQPGADRKTDKKPEARSGDPGAERMARALREMRAQLEKQGQAIERLEKRMDEMSRQRRRE